MILANNYSAGFYYTLLRENPGIITFLQPDFTIQFQSASFYTHTNREPEETVGDNFLQILHPLDVQPLVNLMVAAKADSKAKPHLKLRIRKPDGDYLTVATTVTCVSSYNLVEGYILYSQRVEKDNPEGDAAKDLFRSTEKTMPPPIMTGNGSAAKNTEPLLHGHHRTDPERQMLHLVMEVNKNVMDRSVLVAIADA